MKRLVLLLALALFMCFARAEWNAQLSADGRTLNVRFLNDTDAAVKNVRIICSGETLGEIPGPVKPGGSAAVKLKFGFDESALATLSVTYDAEETLKAGRAVKPEINLYIRMPDRAFSNGETVPAYIIVENTGKTDAKELELSASNGFSQDAVSVNAGEYAEICFPVKVTFPFKLTAKASQGGELLSECAAAEVMQQQFDVEITCATASEIEAGETPHVSITIENRGNTAYTNPVLTASGYGEVNGLPGIIKAESSVTVDTELPALYEDTEIVFRFEGVRDDGVTGRCSSPGYFIKVNGAAPEFKTPVLKTEKVRSTDLLLKIVTLKGLPQIALYVCAGLCAALAALMLARGVRRRKKH